MLFDYAVAVLALGDTQQPGSLAGVLDEDPNLAITVRPSLVFRLAIEWAADSTRRAFWHLALRLASHRQGHLLAAATAAQVAADAASTFADVEELTNACTGTRRDPSGRWGPPEASEMAFLVAAATARTSCRQAALDALAELTSLVAAHARSTGDISLALLAAQLPIRATGAARAALREGAGDKWVAAAVDCMHVALAGLSDQHRVPVARFSTQFLAAVAAHDTHTTADVIHAAIAPAALTAWGATTVLPLIGQIPEIAGTAPGLAVAIGASVWEYEEPQHAQGTASTLVDSAILGLSSTRQQDLEGARYAVAEKFPALLAVSPPAAADLLARIAELPRMYRWSSDPPTGTHPQLLTGDSLHAAGGDRSLSPMADALARKLGQLADAQLADAQHQPPEEDGHDPAGEVIADLRTRLHNSEVWRRLLRHAAEATSPALSQALLPVLTSPSLFAQPHTWIEAGHIAARLSPLLDGQAHLLLEDAILRVPGTWTSGTRREEMSRLLEQRTSTLLAALDPGKISSRGRQGLAGGHVDPAGQLPGLPDGDDFQLYDMPPPPAGSFEALADQVRAAAQQSRDRNPQARTDGLRELAASWDDLKRTASRPRPGATAEQLVR